MTLRNENDDPTPARRTRSRTRSEQAAADSATTKPTRPHGAVANALIFILREIMQNNPDVKAKAEHHIQRLDRLMMRQPEEGRPAPTPPPPPPPPAAPAPEPRKAPYEDDDDEGDEDQEKKGEQAPPAAPAPAQGHPANGGSKTDPQAVAKALATRPSGRFTGRT